MPALDDCCRDFRFLLRISPSCTCSYCSGVVQGGVELIEHNLHSSLLPPRPQGGSARGLVPGTQTASTPPGHVTRVPRADGSSSLLNAPWVANRALGHGAFGAVFDVTLRTEARPRVALKICFAGARRFGIEREIGVLAEVSRRRPAPKTAPAGGLAELETFFAYRDASAVAMRLADTTLSDLAKGLRGVAMRFSEPVALYRLPDRH